MKIIERIRGWIEKMFPPETIKSIYEKNTALFDQMIMSISKWEQMYFGKAPWTDKNVY